MGRLIRSLFRGSRGSDSFSRLALLLLDKMETIEKLFQPVQKKSDDTGNKVTVVGVGQVGMAAVFSLLTQVRFTIVISILI